MIRMPMKKVCVHLAMLVISTLPDISDAQPSFGYQTGVETFEAPSVELLLADHHPVGPEELESSRGGFSLGDNINIDIGFENLVMIDGILQSQTKFSIPSLTSGPIDPATLDMLRIGPVDGSGVAALPSMDTLPLQTLIQNDLDQKVIQSINVLEIQLSNFGSNYNGSMQQLMGQQLIQSLR